MIYIIAEIGFNHEGDINAAIEMIEAAAQSGANAVKFQTFKAFDIALPSSQHYDIIKNGEMSYEQHSELYLKAKDCGIDFISTPFSPWAVELLEKLEVHAYKVASMDCTNKYLLKHIAKTQKPVFISTGMASLNEISDTLDYMDKHNSGQITLMHCISMYPAKAEHLNLDIIPFLKKLFNISIGYSDHYPGTMACLAAALVGSEVIETHFTLDTTTKNGDHFHSADPKSLEKLINDIILLRQMKGNKRMILDRPDRQYANDYRRGLYFSKQLSKGHILSEDDFLFCRPASELSPNHLEYVIGKILDKDVKEYDIVEDCFINKQ